MVEASRRARLWSRDHGGELEACFRLLFDAAPEGMALLDGTGAIVAVNPALVALAGPALAPRPGTAAGLLLAPADQAAFARQLKAAAAGAPTGEPVLVAPADPLAPADTRWALGCRPLAAADGGDHVLLTIQDRTEQRRAAARLAAAGRLETVGRLAGGIAHDFNNLLTAVLGAAEVLRAGPAGAASRLPPDAAAEVATIEDAAKRGAELVRHLLAFARQQRLEARVVDLNAAVEGIQPVLGRVVGTCVTVELALERPGRRVRIDPGQLGQVLLNLATNARDAMPGGGTLRIATGHAVVLRAAGEGPRGVPPGRWAVLEVTDTGPGIPPDVLPRLFEPFFTTRAGQGGTGLGLATVQGVVAQSGGHIEVSNRPEGGACFRVYLPRHDGPADPIPALAPAPPAAAARCAAPGAPLLLVEDETPLRRLAVKVLERAGHAVLPADSAEAALELVGAGAVPGALVSDVTMPGTDGLELARRLRARWPALPVLLVSGYAAGAIGSELAREGLHFLAKPYTPAQLNAAVAALA